MQLFEEAQYHKSFIGGQQISMHANVIKSSKHAQGYSALRKNVLNVRSNDRDKTSKDVK